MSNEWEIIEQPISEPNSDAGLRRRRVEGGWLYERQSGYSTSTPERPYVYWSQPPVFVPDNSPAVTISTGGVLPLDLSNAVQPPIKMTDDHRWSGGTDPYAAGAQMVLDSVAVNLDDKVGPADCRRRARDAFKRAMYAALYSRFEDPQTLREFAWSLRYREEGLSEAQIQLIAEKTPDRMKESPWGTDESGTLVGQLVAQLRAFVAREAPHVRSEVDSAEFKITLHSPQGEDDETLNLSARIECTTTIEDTDGRVPGVKY